MIETTRNKATGIGTDKTMAEMRVPAAQPVVVTEIAPAKAPAEFAPGSMARRGGASEESG
jgi:hypothetical protein